MTNQELFAIIEELRKKHGEEFKRWYDQANFTDVEYYCEIGYLVSRSWPTSDS